MGWELEWAPQARQAFWQNASQTHPVRWRVAEKTELLNQRSCERDHPGIYVSVLDLYDPS